MSDELKQELDKKIEERRQKNSAELRVLQEKRNDLQRANEDAFEELQRELQNEREAYRTKMLAKLKKAEELIGRPILLMEEHSILRARDLRMQVCPAEIALLALPLGDEKEMRKQFEAQLKMLDNHRDEEKERIESEMRKMTENHEKAMKEWRERWTQDFEKLKKRFAVIDLELELGTVEQRNREDLRKLNKQCSELRMEKSRLLKDQKARQEAEYNEKKAELDIRLEVAEKKRGAKYVMTWPMKTYPILRHRDLKMELDFLHRPLSDYEGEEQRAEFEKRMKAMVEKHQKKVANTLEEIETVKRETKEKLDESEITHYNKLEDMMLRYDKAFREMDAGRVDMGWICSKRPDRVKTYAIYEMILEEVDERLKKERAGLEEEVSLAKDERMRALREQQQQLREEFRQKEDELKGRLQALAAKSNKPLKFPEYRPAEEEIEQIHLIEAVLQERDLGEYRGQRFKREAEGRIESKQREHHRKVERLQEQLETIRTRTIEQLESSRRAHQERLKELEEVYEPLFKEHGFV